MNYDTLATAETIQQLTPVFADRGITVISIANAVEALAKVQTMIPAGASVMNGSSRTLEQIGFMEYLKSDAHNWNNLHAPIVVETDPVKQGMLRHQAVLSEYYVGSVHAISQTGELVWGSNTGSQLPHLVFTSPNVILVAGAQKIVPTLQDALKRLEEYVIPLEDVNMQQKYGMGTMLCKTLIMHKENTMMGGRKITLLVVNEKLGF